MQGSPKEGRTADGRLSYVRLLKCAWSDRATFRDQLVASPFQLGHLYPHLPLSGARCVEVDTEPFGGMQGNADSGGDSLSIYDDALLTVRYETPRIQDPQPAPVSSGNPDPTDIISEDIVPSVEFLTIATRRAWWDAARTEPVSEDGAAPGVRIRGFVWKFTRYNMAEYPDEWDEANGSVNDAVLKSPLLKRSFNAETLLFSVDGVKIKYWPDGTITFDVTAALQYRKVGWNKFPRPIDGGYVNFQRVYGSNGEPYEPYPKIDLKSLLKIK